VSVQGAGRVEPEPPDPGGERSVDDRSRRIGGTILPVRPPREDRDAIEVPVQVHEGGQHQLLIPPSPAGAGSQPHGGLSPREKTGGSGNGQGRLAHPARDPRQHLSYLAALPLHEGAEVDHAIAECAGGPGCPLQREPVVPQDLVGDPPAGAGEGFGVFPADPFSQVDHDPAGRRFQEVEAAQHVEGIAIGGGVGSGRSGGDDVERIPHHVGDDQAHDPGPGGADEPSSLDEGQVLADGVHLSDVRPRPVQQRGDPPLVGQSDLAGGKGPEGGASPRDKAED